MKTILLNVISAMLDCTKQFVIGSVKLLAEIAGGLLFTLMIGIGIIAIISIGLGPISLVALVFVPILFFVPALLEIGFIILVIMLALSFLF